MAKIYPRQGSPYWWVRFKGPNGVEIRQSSKVPQKEELKKQAELLANDWELAAWKGWLPGQEQRPVYSYDQLVERYLDECGTGSAGLNNILRLNTFFEGMPLSELSPALISDYKAMRANTVFRGKHISQPTIRRELATFSAMLKKAKYEWGWEIDNPIPGRLPKASRGVVRWLTPEEADRLLLAADQQARQPALRDFITLGLNTGMRKMEMLGLEISRIDFRNRTIHLNPEHQKSGEYGVVPLNEEAFRAITDRLHWIKKQELQTSWLFPGADSGGEHHITDIRRSFRAACKVAGIENFRVHDLRHTFASWLVQRGVPIYEVKQLLRHSSIETTEKYAHLAPVNTARHVDLLNE
ncbi:MAG: site-specific integrase [Halieaceae bacterium]